MMGTTAFATEADSISTSDDVEFICENEESTSSLIKAVASSIVWGTAGGRETARVDGVVKQRVWGWSTCKDGIGQNVYHYTVAQYENILGVTNSDRTSGRVWGTGTVYAYSPYVLDGDIADNLLARVYYGY
ncbi:MAG: hypothetical protein LIO58_07780 [Oscillospiraceae bacterium]|nr:hypothetical protein [Oscillospiraceae bacterium]